MNKSRSLTLVCLCLLLGITLCPVDTAADEKKESLVKAAFIYNFVKFIEWPADKAISKLSSIDICTLGNNGISSAGQVFKAASTEKLTLSLVKVQNWQEAKGHCHVLYISPSESAQIHEIISGLASSPVLTVSEIDSFIEKGGIIGFITHENKIKVGVNTQAAARAGLHVDAQLLEIALKVIEK